MREQGVLRAALPADRGRRRQGGRRGAGAISPSPIGESDDPQAACADRRHLQRCRRGTAARAFQAMTEALLAQAYLALGGNVGNSRAILDRAVALLCNGTEVRLTARSSDYQTPPWGFKYQSPFINLCIAVETELSPRELLARAQGVELQLGRDRAHEKRWGPRTADIDIIAYGALTVDELGLTLPHPRLFERAFVLLPLAEIAPDRVIGGRKVRDALYHVDSARI